MSINDPKFLMMFSYSFIKRFQGSVRRSNFKFIVFAESLIFSSDIPVPAGWMIHEILTIIPFAGKYA